MKIVAHELVEDGHLVLLRRGNVVALVPTGAVNALENMEYDTILMSSSDYEAVLTKVDAANLRQA